MDMNIGFDIDSYMMGKKDGGNSVEISGNGVTFTDPNNDGNIVVTVEEGE